MLEGGLRNTLLRRFDRHMGEIVSGASVAFVMKGLGEVLTFLFNVVLARMLGADGAGIFFLALTVTTISSVFGRMGLDNTLVRFIAANAGIGNWTAVKGVYRKGMMLALAASTVAALLMFAAVPWLADVLFKKPEAAIPMRWMALSVVPLALQILSSEALKGLKQIFAATILQIQGIMLAGLSLLGLYLLGRSWGTLGAVWAHNLATGATMLAGFVLWRTATPHLAGVKGIFEVREILSSSLPLFWVASMNLVMNWTATIGLGICATSADVGVFSVASRTAMLTSAILFAVNSISGPKFAELFRQGELEALGRLARNSVKLMIVVAGPALIFFAVFAKWLMGLYGAQFVGGALVLVVLSIGQFVNTATGSVGYLLVMSGNERLVRNNVIFIAALNISLNIILIPSAGVIGAALATAISLAAKNLIAAYLVWKRLKIQTIPLDWIGIG